MSTEELIAEARAAMWAEGGSHSGDVIRRLADELEAAHGRLAAVGAIHKREHHRAETWDGDVCFDCVDDWPCRTAVAAGLDGAQ